MKLVSIVIPAYNEEETIGMVLDDLFKTLKRMKGYHFETIVVDNNSTDKTAAIAKQKGAAVLHEQKKGKGNALKAGFAGTRGDMIIMMDADYSHRPEDIPFFLKKIEGGNGLVIGSRITGGSEEYTSIRSFGNIMLTAAFTTLFGISFTDVLNGYKAFRKELIKNYEYHSSDFQIEIELVANALRAGYQIAEIPSHERIRAGGKMKSMALVHGPKFLYRIIKEGIKYRTGL
ncbi:MAG TPA: glycosyltransferase family 2 protein [Candidatus Nanoarchaeia archaeon]|nr:glycosyltransferase family 2 protein [Candidatus Nanoarchaeia archaeon]